MKKIISIFLICLLVFICACGEENTESTNAAEGESSEDFSDIDEFTPVDGVYMIHTPEGLKNMANHLDGSFELLCDIDMGGENWTPVGSKSAPFTGSFNGRKGGVQFVIKNFVIDKATSDGEMGFFGTNKGQVKNISLKDVTVKADNETSAIGIYAGTNEGKILRGEGSGTVAVSAAKAGCSIGGVVGVNAGEISTLEVDFAVECDANVSANVGGIAGLMTAGSMNDITNKGKIAVSNGNDKLIGLFIGNAANGSADTLKYYGASNKASGQKITAFFGKEENFTHANIFWRDNFLPELTEKQAALRSKVEQTMREMGSIEWTVSQSMGGECICKKNNTMCSKTYVPGMRYIGLPYQHKAGNLARFKYCLDENNVVKDWVYDLGSADGFDTYLGSDCSSSVQHSWASIANSMNVGGTGWMMPDKGRGTLPVGEYVWQLPDGKTSNFTTDYRDATGEVGVYEALAYCRMGDAVVSYTGAGGHVRLVAKDAVTIRDEAGKIDPSLSYIVTHEQGHTCSGDDWESTWTLDRINSFQSLYEVSYMPITIKELVTGERETPTATLEGGTDGRAGLTSGIVKSNYFLNSVSMVITDIDGNEVFNQEMFTTVGKNEDYGTWEVDLRDLQTEYNLAHFAQPLGGIKLDVNMQYHCVITAHLGCYEDIVVKDYKF